MAQLDSERSKEDCATCSEFWSPCRIFPCKSDVSAGNGRQQITEECSLQIHEIFLGEIIRWWVSAQEVKNDALRPLDHLIVSNNMTSERIRKARTSLGRAEDDGKHAERKLAEHEMLGLRKPAPPSPPHVAGTHDAVELWGPGTSRSARAIIRAASGSRVSGSHRSSRLRVSFGCRGYAGSEVRWPAAAPRRPVEGRGETGEPDDGGGGDGGLFEKCWIQTRALCKYI